MACRRCCVLPAVVIVVIVMPWHWPSVSQHHHRQSCQPSLLSPSLSLCFANHRCCHHDAVAICVVLSAFASCWHESVCCHHHCDAVALAICIMLSSSPCLASCHHHHCHRDAMALTNHVMSSSSALYWCGCVDVLSPLSLCLASCRHRHLCCASEDTLSPLCV